MVYLKSNALVVIGSASGTRENSTEFMELKIDNIFLSHHENIYLIFSDLFHRFSHFV